MSDGRIPVTLLTGFLGAGKTTLLNALLSSSDAGKIAVVVNEFGEAGLDHDLIEMSSDDIVLMQSGCLCCSVRGDLSGAIRKLIFRRDDGEFDFDRIVIETTGLADPGPILQTLLVDRYLATTTRMDGVVTLVDAVNGATTLDKQFEAVSQVAMADMIVLSKTDLADPEAVVRLEERLRVLNTNAQVRHAVKGTGVQNALFGLFGLRPGVTSVQALDWVGSPTKSADPFANLSGLAAPKAPQAVQSPHDDKIATASIVIDDPLPDDVFDDWLNTLVQLQGPNLLRVKGIVFLEGMDFPFVFHGVQQIFDPPVPLRDWPAHTRRSRIVVIARDIPEPVLQRMLNTLRDRLDQHRRPERAEATQP
ncbi:GTP-binding protein [uncultured Maritimibacter sp.]|jgi:G3E family GTPase|uniref:CobW family GTP-binding protein n=1 Tax=uncultured Maritimibacter sp. TaxID=991866 RepID=UPI000A914625|nr:GTP-binding protein [uncultured Maritimibacter sp.]